MALYKEKVKFIEAIQYRVIGNDQIIRPGHTSPSSENRYVGLLVYSNEHPSVPTTITDNDRDEVKAMEVSVADYPSYSRCNITYTRSEGFDTPTLDTTNNDRMFSWNKDEIHFRTVDEAGGWGTIIGFALFSSLSGGNPIYWGSLTSTVSAQQDTVPLIKAHNLVLEIK